MNNCNRFTIISLGMVTKQKTIDTCIRIIDQSTFIKFSLVLSSINS